MSPVLRRDQVGEVYATPHVSDDTLLANARMQRLVAEDLLRRVVEIVGHIEYKVDYEIVVTLEQQQVWIQPRFWRKDIVSHLYEWGYGGKAVVTESATTSQIVQMVFGLFKALEEHECREWFTYLGERVFGPHIDINALVEVANDTDHEFGTR